MAGLVVEFVAVVAGAAAELAVAAGWSLELGLLVVLGVWLLVVAVWLVLVVVTRALIAR